MAERKKSQGREVLTGVVANYERPDWTALENVVEDCVCGDFMWMCEHELEDGTRIHAYKHRWNRRYVHLSERGEAFVYLWRLDGHDYDPDAPSEYERVRLRDSLAAVLGPPRWPAVEIEREHAEREQMAPTEDSNAVGQGG